MIDRLTGALRRTGRRRPASRAKRPNHTARRLAVETLESRRVLAAEVSIAPTSGLTTTEAGGTATFDVVLTQVPTADVSFNVISIDLTEGTLPFSTLTFTPANWNVVQQVTITGVDDQIDDDNVNYLIVTDPVISADSAYNGFNPPDITVVNIDDEIQGITVTPTSGLETTEAGGTASFTVVLTFLPTADVTVALSSTDMTEGTVSPASVTFTAANGKVPQTVTVTGVDDQIDDDEVIYSIVTAPAVSGDTKYNGLDATDVAVTNHDDPNDTAGITVTATAELVTTEAGGTASFSVVLNTQPLSDVVIGLSTSDPTEGFVAITSVTFNDLNWNVPQLIAVTGLDDAIDDGDVAYSIVTAAAVSGDPKYNGLNAADVSVTNLDDPNETAGITVSPTGGLTTTEAGGTATFTIVLDTQPLGDVAIDLTSNDLTEGTVSPATLTFTAGNWNLPQTVTVAGVDDSIDDDSVVYSIVTSAAVSGDPKYGGLNPDDASVINLDDPGETAGIFVSPTFGLTTTELGGTTTFTIALTTQPTGDVTVGVSSNDATEGTVSPATVTFNAANWNLPQNVTVTGVADSIDDGDVEYSILTVPAVSGDLKYSGLNGADVLVTNLADPNNVAGILVVPTSGLTTTEAGGAATFTIALNTQPSADVTVGLSSSNVTEGTVDLTSVTFTPANWNAPQLVTVTGVDDVLDDNDVTYSIVTAAAVSSDAKYNNLDAADASVTNLDNEVPGFTVAPTSGLSTTELGGSATFTVVLNTQPTADVTVDLSSSDTTEGTVSPGNITFTAANWNGPQTVTVTGVSDPLDDGDIPYTIVTAAAVSADSNYNGLNPADVSVANLDDPADVAGITVTPTSGLTTTELGGSATFTIVLQTEPTADVTVALSSSDTTEGSVSPASFTFTALNWNVPQTVTVTGASDLLDDGDVAYTIVTAAAVSADAKYNGLNPPDVSVTNLDDPADVAGITVTPTSGLTTTELGSTATFTVVLNTQPTSDVTVAITSSDTTEGTIAPASVTFTALNWNVSQTITVTGASDLLDDGDVAYTIVTAAAVSADAKYNGLNPADVSVTNLDDPADVAGVTVTPTSGLITTEAGGTATFTVVLNTQPAADVSFEIASSDISEGTVLPTSVTFTTASWNVPRTITVTGVPDAIDDDNVAYTIVTSTTLSSDPKYNVLNPADVSVTNTDTSPNAAVQFGATSLTLAEGTSTSTTVRLASQPLADVTITLTPSLSGQVTLSPAQVVFTPDNWNVPLTIAVQGTNDQIVEPDKTIAIASSVTSLDTKYQALTPASISALLEDDDATTITLSALNLSQPEGTGGGTTAYAFRAASSAAVEGGFRVAYTTNDGTATAVDQDYTDNDGNLTFVGTAAENQTITVQVAKDSKPESDENFGVALGAVTNIDPSMADRITIAGSPATSTIQDDDTSHLAITPVTLAEGSGSGTTDFSFTVTLTHPFPGGFSVNYTTSDGTATLADGDYVDNDGTLNFAGTDNETKTITIRVNRDAKVETNENFVVTLSPVAGVIIDGSPAQGSITNDDTATVVFASSTSLAVEQAGSHSINARLNVPGGGTISAPVTVAITDALVGAATTPGDYTLNTTSVVFPAGSADGATQPVTLTLVSDAVTEVDETLQLQLGGITSTLGSAVSVGTPGTVDVTITDDSSTGSISGVVWVDLNGNGTRDTGEASLPGAIVVLSGRDLRSRVVEITTSTDSTGAYRFANLPGGTYDVRETQPSGFADAAEQLGTVGGTASGTAGADAFTGILLAPAAQGVNYNFGEGALKPQFVSRLLFVASQQGSSNFVREVSARAESISGNAALANVILQSQTVEVRRIADQIQVTGSDVSDSIIFTPANSISATDTTKHTVEVNGLPFSFPAADVSHFRFDGGAGTNDTMQLRDSRGNDHLQTGGNSAVLSSTDYQAEAIAMELVKAISASGGSDTKSQQSAIDFVLELEGTWTDGAG